MPRYMISCRLEDGTRIQAWFKKENDTAALTLLEKICPHHTEAKLYRRDLRKLILVHHEGDDEPAPESHRR